MSKFSLVTHHRLGYRRHPFTKLLGEIVKNKKVLVITAAWLALETVRRPTDATTTK